MNLPNSETNKNGKAKNWPTFLATLSANITTISVGNCIGWTSPVGPKLKSSDYADSPLDHTVSVKEIAWITSTLSIGAAITPFLAAPLADKIGRKPVLLLSSIFFALAFIVMLIAKNFWLILIGRLLQGIGVGFVYSIIPMYVGEISNDKIRGVTLGLMTFFIVVGLNYVFCIGPFVSYAMLQYCCLLIPITFVAFFIFMPESPIFYIEKNDMLKAQKSLQFLRGQNAEAVLQELSIMERMVINSKSQSIKVMDLLRLRGNQKALCICLVLIAMQQSTGINAIAFNIQTIFERANIEIEAHIASIIVSSVLLFASILGPIAAYTFSRRLILYISSVLMALGLFALGTFFYFDIVIKNTAGITWIPVPAMMLYMVFYVAGFSPIPFTLLGEMFSPNIKSFAIKLGASTCWLTAFIVTFSYPIIAEFGAYYAFWLYTLVCVIAFFFVMFVVIETKNMSLDEIQNKLQNNM